MYIYNTQIKLAKLANPLDNCRVQSNTVFGTAAPTMVTGLQLHGLQ